MGLTRGRVIAADGTTSLHGEATEISVRILPREHVEAHEAARHIVIQAQQAAKKIQQQAEQEAEALLARARNEGQAEAEAAVAAKWLTLKQAEERWHRERESDLFGIARLLAERLLLRELSLNQDTIVDLARQALMPLKRARQLRFSVHPEDVEPLRQGLASLELNVDRIEVTLDPTAPRGAIRIFTELGAVRAELAPQLDRLLTALRAP